MSVDPNLSIIAGKSAFSLGDLLNDQQQRNVRQQAIDASRQEVSQRQAEFARTQQQQGIADTDLANLKAAAAQAGTGDYTGADAKYGLGVGDIGIHEKIAALRDEHRAQARAQYAAAIPVAIQALGTPDPAARKALIAAAAPQLLASGWHQQELDAFDPTDANLQSLIAGARTADDALKLYDKQNEPYTMTAGQHRFVGSKEVAGVPDKPMVVGSALVDPTTGKPLYEAPHYGTVSEGAKAYVYQPGTTPDAVWSNMLTAEAGTNANGTFRTSPKGAVGPAQVMPGTGPQAAALAGLPWDAKRYRTDASYNTAIGRAYFDEQLKNFGDPALAAAAYNAGPGRVMAALQKGGPQDWMRYVPQETRDYVNKATGGSTKVIAEGAPKTPDAPSGYRFKADGSLEAIPGGPANNAVLDEPTRALMADQYLAGDKSVLQNLGRGTQGAKNIVLLRQEILKQAQMRGMSGADIATSMAQFNGLTAQARTIGNIGGKVEYGTNELSASIPLAQQASNALPRGNWVPINRIQQMVQSGTSSPQLKDLLVKTNAVINAYNLVAARGGTSVTQREHNAELLRSADGPAAYSAALRAMQTEAATAHRASQQTMTGIGTGHGQGNQAPPQAAQSAPPPRNRPPLSSFFGR